MKHTTRIARSISKSKRKRLYTTRKTKLILTNPQNRENALTTTTTKTKTRNNKAKVTQENKEKQNKKMSKVSYKTYIYKVFKDVNPSLKLSANVKDQFDQNVQKVAEKIANQAQSLTVKSNKKTISSREIQTATMLIFNGELKRHAVNEGVKAVTKFMSSGAGGKNKPKSKAERAGLVFPPYAAEKVLRGHSNLFIGEGAPVYLAAVLQYLVSELAETSGKVARGLKKVTVAPRHLFLALQDDEELQDLVSNNDLKVVGGGVVPEILPKFQPEENTKETLPLKKIKKYQNSTSLCLQKGPFKDAAKDVLCEFYPKSQRPMVGFCRKKTTDQIRLGDNAALALQHFAESQAIDFIKDSLKLAVHAGRETLEPRDVDLVVAMKGSSFSKNASPEVIKHFTNPGLERLCYKAGAKRIGTKTHDSLRTLVGKIIQSVLEPTYIIVQHNRSKTVSLDFLNQGAASIGHWVPVITPPQTQNMIAMVKSVKAKKESPESNEEPEEEHEDEPEQESNEE